MPVNHRQEEVVVFSQILLNAADDHGAVRIANLFDDDPDGIGAA